MKKNKKVLIIAHGDYDGIASTVLLAKDLHIAAQDIQVVFTQPFLVDRVKIPNDIEQVYVVDIAVNNRDVEMTRKFIAQLGNKLRRWFDHHKGWERLLGITERPKRFVIDDRVASCAEVVHAIYRLDRLAYADFLEQTLYWPGAVNRKSLLRKWSDDQTLVFDANAADTRQGKLSPQAELIENACKANILDDSVRVAAVKWLLGDKSQKPLLEAAAKKYAAIQKNTMRLASTYKAEGKIAVVDARKEKPGTFDLAQLLLEGQKKATFAVAITVNPHTREEIITVATLSGKNLVEIFRLPSGSPSRVTLPAEKLEEVIKKLNSL